MIAAAAMHEPRTIQSTAFGTFVLLSTTVSQHELLETLHDTRPRDRLHR
jgi:hypothetical protein